MEIFYGELSDTVSSKMPVRLKSADDERTGPAMLSVDRIRKWMMVKNKLQSCVLRFARTYVADADSCVPESARPEKACAVMIPPRPRIATSGTGPIRTNTKQFRD